MAPLKLKGYVLLESMFSMVVIMLCFGIAMMVFNIVIGSSSGSLSTRARIRLHTEAAECKTENRLIDEDIPLEDFTVERRVIPYNGNEHLSELRLKAVSPDGKILAEYHELIAH